MKDDLTSENFDTVLCILRFMKMDQKNWSVRPRKMQYSCDVFNGHCKSKIFAFIKQK